MSVGLAIALGVFVALRPQVAWVAVALGLVGAAIARLRLRPSEAALVGLTVSLGLLPAVPRLTAPITLFVAGMAGVTLIASLVTGPIRWHTADVLIVYLGTTLLWSDVSIAEAGRAVVPFLFLALYRCWDLAPKWWPAALELSGLLLAARVILVAGTGIGRATWASLDFILPLHLVGAVFAIERAIRPGLRLRTRSLAALSGVIQLGGLALTQTRGLVLAAGLGLLVLAASYGLGRAIKLGVMAGLAVTTGILYLGAASESGRLLAARFSTEGFASGLNVRQLELAAATEVWLDSVTFGAGLGTTFANPVAGSSGGVVSYVHNSVMYMLVAGGLIAALLYVALYVGIVRRTFSRRPGISAAAVAMFGFGLTTAGFRSIHFNVALALLLGASLSRDAPPGVAPSSSRRDADAM